MAENKQISTDYDIDAKWDACLDLSLRRVVYSSLTGAFTGLLLFRSPVTRWASIAFGAGAGLGSAYSDCSQLFGRPAPVLKCSNASEPLKESSSSTPTSIPTPTVSQEKQE